MCSCSCSQNIKQATELTALGEQLSETELEVAHALHACRMPAWWRQLCGEQLAPPPSFALSSFFADLYARSQHLEKMLTLVRISPLPLASCVSSSANFSTESCLLVNMPIVYCLLC